MKNRTVIGILCIVFAVAVVFLVSPLINTLSLDTTKVVRLSQNIARGAVIEKADLETVVVKTNTLPLGTLKNETDIIGRYAVSALYAGDYLTASKLTDEANTADAVLENLNGSKVAVSMTISSFAAGLSGKLENGDIVSVIAVSKDGKESTIPAQLQYLRVITATTSGGIDQDDLTAKEDGTREAFNTITVLVTPEQARILTQYENNCTLRVALVYRGDPATVQKFIEKQDSIL